MHRPEDIHQAKARALQEQQDSWMREGKDHRQVGRPAMQREEVQATMRPKTEGAVAQRDQHSQQQVDGDDPHRAEAKIRAEIQ